MIKMAYDPDNFPTLDIMEKYPVTFVRGEAVFRKGAGIRPCGICPPKKSSSSFYSDLELKSFFAERDNVMKYAVIYQSKSGNTELIAQKICQELRGEDVALIDIEKGNVNPYADVYFIGFGIHNLSCSSDMINYMERLTAVRYALFVTCGLPPTEKYKKELERRLEIWLPEYSECLGMFFCQGKVEKRQQKRMISQYSEKADQLQIIFEQGMGCPGRHDLAACAEFVKGVKFKLKER